MKVVFESANESCYDVHNSIMTKSMHLRLAIALLALSSVFGCTLTVPSGDDTTERDSHSQLQSERAPAHEIWLALARAIDAKTITSTTRLTQFVVVLKRNGDLSAADLDAFDSTFSGISKTDRPLTADDASRLRSMKDKKRSMPE